MAQLINLQHRRFGKLVVLERYSPVHHPKIKMFKDRTFWVCKCDCGQNYIAWAYLLRKGLTTHCGCSRMKRASTKEII